MSAVPDGCRSNHIAYPFPLPPALVTASPKAQFWQCQDRQRFGSFVIVLCGPVTL